MLEKKHILTLSGTPGSGKSSTARKLAEILNYKHFSAGAIVRAIAEERGMSIEEISKHAKDDPSLDAKLEERLIELVKKENDIVIESRTALYWAIDAFKVFLKIEPHVAALRTYNQIKTEGRRSETASSLEEIEHSLNERLAAEKDRYQKYYRLDYTDESQYDLVIDSGVHELNERVEMIAEKYKGWLGI